MKPFLALIPLLALCFLSSCKKTADSGSTGSITATVDGTKQVFNFSAKALLAAPPGTKSLTLIGSENKTSDAFAIQIQLFSDEMGAGTYTSNSTANIAQISYSQQSTSLVYVDDGTVTGSTCTVIISSISTSHVKGTFNGVLALQTGTGPAVKTVTGGSFDLDIN